MFLVLSSKCNVTLLTMGVEVVARQVECFGSRPHFLNYVYAAEIAR